MNYDLDTPLIEFATKSGKCPWTIRHAVEGLQIFGGIGSGKTSGSGGMLALKYLANGFGGLILTVKADEREMWEEYCRLTNRTSDLIVVAPQRKNFFNVLDYENQHNDSTKDITDNIVQVLQTVIRASEEKSSGKSDDPFWEAALTMLLFSVIDLCKLAYGKVSVKDMFEIVQSIPKSGENNSHAETKKKEKTAFEKAFEAAIKNTMQRTDNWCSAQPKERISHLVEENLLDEEICIHLPEARLLRNLDQFFNGQYISLSEKTRSIIDFSFTGFLFRFLREPVYSTFCSKPSTFTPDDCLNGKIILLDFPVKIFQKVGRDIQIMFKYIWQRAMEKRDIKENDRPVFLWADEAQNFLHEHDSEYQATARSSRIATVYISQNLPNYYANMGGAKADFRVKSFLGTLGTKIFHANADIETNRYASDLIGDGIFEEVSKTSTAAGTFSSSKTKSLKLDRLVRPEEFVFLRTGGPKNDFKVDGIIHQQGLLFANDNGFSKIRFNQNYSPLNKLIQ